MITLLKGVVCIMFVGVSVACGQTLEVAVPAAHEANSKKSIYTQDCYHPWNVVTASPIYTLGLYLSILFLKASSSNVSYAVEAVAAPALSPTWKVFEICPQTHVGFDVGFSAIFHAVDTMMTFDWEHLRSSSWAKQSVIAPDYVGPFFEMGPDEASFQKARGCVAFQLDQLALDYGQLVHFGDYLRAHLFVGINGTRLAQTQSTHFSDLDNTITRIIYVPSRFLGAGPHFGCAVNYAIFDEFYFVGKIALSLLSGNIKNYTIYSSRSPALVDEGMIGANIQRLCVQKRFQIVPAFEEKLGLSYALPFCRDNMLELEIGYQAQLYCNALQSVDIATQSVDNANTQGVYARTFKTTVSNGAFGGPYVLLNMGF